MQLQLSYTLRKCLVPLVLGVLLAPALGAEQGFFVGDIRVIGIQRVSAGSIFTVMPISVGDTLSRNDLQRTMRALFETGQFDDIQIGREDDTLLISVVERPSISSLVIEGNKAIKTPDLLKGLAESGLSEGQVFKRSTLEGLRLELQRQYVAQGRYGARVEVASTPEPRNRIALMIEIDEGQAAVIAGINLVGNKSHSDEKLLENFELAPGNWLSFFTNDNKYSRERLKGDLEKLESFYFDRGYVKFSIDSTQVSITPDKRKVYIAINVVENNIYKVHEINLAGDLPIPEEQLRPLILIEPGDIFNQAQITAVEEFFVQRLGNEGYTFANVSGVPSPDDETGNVDITFYIEPGPRAYANRVVFSGNKSTIDEVLRREMRQLEGTWASTSRIEISKLRLERLGFFSGVSVETAPVPGTVDQLEVHYSVQEQPSGSIQGSIGYGSNGVNLGFSIEQKNFLGTGKRVKTAITRNRTREQLSFDYFDPYYTIDGISRGYNGYYRKTDYSNSNSNVSRYSADNYGGGIQFGYPVSEVERMALTLATDYTKITNPSNSAAAEVRAFLARQGNAFFNYKAEGIWSLVTLNRGLFPTRGISHALSLETTLPESDLNYLRAIYKHKSYWPLGSWVLGFRSRLGAVITYKGHSPFFENFRAGGFGSVRGFENNTLGPRATGCVRSQPTVICDEQIWLDDGNTPRPISTASTNTELVAQDTSHTNAGGTIGGQFIVEGGLDFIFPLSFLKDQSSLRAAMYVDWGNIYTEECEIYQHNCNEFDLRELRYAAGIGFTWITGFGPMTFSLSKPYNFDKRYDKTEEFQFTIGRSL